MSNVRENFYRRANQRTIRYFNCFFPFLGSPLCTVLIQRSHILCKIQPQHILYASAQRHLDHFSFDAMLSSTIPIVLIAKDLINYFITTFSDCIQNFGFNYRCRLIFLFFELLPTCIHSLYNVFVHNRSCLNKDVKMIARRNSLVVNNLLSALRFISSPFPYEEPHFIIFYDSIQYHNCNFLHSMCSFMYAESTNLKHFDKIETNHDDDVLHSFDE